MLKFEIHCDVDAAWRAIHSPQVASELYGPILAMTPWSSVPPAWEHGDNAAVALSVAGLPLGKQFISISDREQTHAGRRVRIMRDSGIPLTGMLSSLDVWDHQMAVSAVPCHPDRTLWRDRLTIGGATAPLLWPALWAVWQWRQLRITQLAPSWAFDPPPNE
ncbi:hypothetical protein [Microbacterium sp. NC79]|uniref:hypothetical protein n=1 Tax=Microbacterium sp. NC79 TaxID=2851009 RepID=UPI0020B8ACE2|nr:hypothetical protein [Microbacterium sp. NC79]